MHISPDAMKTIAFVLLLALVAFYMQLAQAPRRTPRSLIDFTRHRHDEPDPTDEPSEPEAQPTRPRRARTS